MRIELAALIVEAVAHLVADHRADRAVIDRRIGVRIEEGRLQDRGREGDLVRQRVVISVHRLRGHVPTGVRSTGLGKRFSCSFHSKSRGADRIAERIALDDLQRRIVDILDRMADARIERGELLERGLAGRLVHPAGCC